MSMSYCYASAAGVRVSRERAIRALVDHGLETKEIQLFLRKVNPGQDCLYDAQDVLRWLVGIRATYEHAA